MKFIFLVYKRSKFTPVNYSNYKHVELSKVLVPVARLSSLIIFTVFCTKTKRKLPQLFKPGRYLTAAQKKKKKNSL